MAKLGRLRDLSRSTGELSALRGGLYAACEGFSGMKRRMARTGSNDVSLRTIGVPQRRAIAKACELAQPAFAPRPRRRAAPPR